MTEPATEPLPKPDKPGLWRVRWSNGDCREVVVFEVNGSLYYRERHSERYPVRDGWLGAWTPV